MSLPRELLFETFKYLAPEILCKICLVCKVWNEISSSDKLWNQHVNLFWRKNEQHNASWKSLYVHWARSEINSGSIPSWLGESKINATEPEIFFKFTIIGGSLVGKSSLTTRFLEDSIPNNTRRTIGVEFYRKMITIGNKVVNIILWDTYGGKDRYGRSFTHYCRGSHGIFVLFDVTSANSMSFVRKILLPEAKRYQTLGNTEMIVVGCKIDLKNERQVSYQEGYG